MPEDNNRKPWRRKALFLLVALNVLMAGRLWWVMGRGDGNTERATLEAELATFHFAGIDVDRTNPLLVLKVDVISRHANELQATLGSDITNAATVVVLVSADARSEADELRSRLPKVAVLQIGDVPPDGALASIGWGEWLLFDTDGVKRADGTLVMGGARAAIDVLLGRREPFLTAAAKGLDADWARQVTTLTRLSQGETGIVLFVSRAATTCPIADIIGEMNGRFARGGTNVLVVIPSDWSAAEESGFLAAFDVRVPVTRADQSLDEKWKKLAEVYGQDQAGSFAAVVDQVGLTAVYTDVRPIRAALEGA